MFKMSNTNLILWETFFSLLVPYILLSAAAKLSRSPLISTGGADILFRMRSHCFQNFEQALTGHSFNIHLGGPSSWSV